MTQYRFVVRKIKRWFRPDEEYIVVQRYADTTEFHGGWISHSMKWVDARPDDIGRVVFDLLCKKEK